MQVPYVFLHLTVVVTVLTVTGAVDKVVPEAAALEDSDEVTAEAEAASTIAWLLCWCSAIKASVVASSVPISSIACLIFSSISFINSLYLVLTLLAILSLSSMVWRGVLFLGALPKVLIVGFPLLSNVPWGSRFKSIICK